MLKNAYLDAKIGVDPAENEPRKELPAAPSAPIAAPAASPAFESTAVEVMTECSHLANFR